jgi:uncharacterized protein (DUF433 family)
LQETIIVRGIGPLNEMLDICEDEHGPYFMVYPLDAVAGNAYWGVHYPVVIEEHEGQCIATAPSLPILIASGMDRDEAKRNLASEIKAYLRRTVPLIAEYIAERVPHHGDGDAWIDTFGIAVWALIGSLEAVHADAQQVAKDYDIPLDAVEAARVYYLLNKPLIDARRAANRVRSVA